MARYGMAGNYYERRRQTNMLNLSDMPDHRSEYSIDMSDLSGGINLKELPYKLKTNESPLMQNMWWEDGALCCRDGQAWNMEAKLGTAYSCYEGLYHDYAFIHVGSSIYYFNPYTLSTDYRAITELIANVPENRGTWFTYGDYLMYKNNGGYYRIQLGAPIAAATPHMVTRNYYRQKRSSSMRETHEALDKVKLYPNVKISAAGKATVIGDPVEKRFTAAKANFIGWYHVGSDNKVYKLREMSTVGTSNYWDFELITSLKSTLFTYSDPQEFCYTPVMYINCNPYTGAGDSYQPENRLSSQKTFWYTPTGETRTVTGTYLAASALTQYSDVTLNCGFTMETGLYGFEATVNWYSDSARTSLVNSRAVSYYNVTTGTFITSVPKAMATGDTLYWSVDIYVSTDSYQIPLSGGVTSVDYVIVADKNGIDHQCTAAASGEYTYTVTTNAGGYSVVKFNFNPVRTTPLTANTVKITVTKANSGAMSSILSCNRAITYGGTTDAVIVFGGCEAQPNAYFWNGNNTAMDAGYVPFDHYNLGGGSDEMITQFGKQQGYLIIFKENSIGRASLSSTEIGTSDVKRVYLTLDYTAINHKVGCDLPWSVQLCQNNLVFANSKTGVFILNDSSSAYENNVTDISDKIEGTAKRAGLFDDIRAIITNGGTDTICSYVGEMRYWLVVNNHAWLWDFGNSTYKDPTWFFLTEIACISFFSVGVQLYDKMKTDVGYFGMTQDGKIVQFNQTCSDFGGAINKIYRTMTMNFGSYDRLKDITSCIFTLMRRDNARNIIEVEYGIEMDNAHEERTFKEPYAINQDYGIVDRRRPSIKRCHHFYIELSNNMIDCDMSISVMQVFYKYDGRQRGNGR